MSMWVNLARVTPEAFARIERDPHLLGPLFLEQDDTVLATLGVAVEDISGLDYDSAEDMIEATADLDDDQPAGDDEDGEDDDHGDEGDDDLDDADEADGDDDEEPGDVVLADLHVDGVLGYDAGFGSAFYLTPASAKLAAASSAALQLDDEAKAIVQAAGERGHYIVGVVS